MDKNRPMGKKIDLWDSEWLDIVVLWYNCIVHLKHKHQHYLCYFDSVIIIVTNIIIDKTQENYLEKSVGDGMAGQSVRGLFCMLPSKVYPWCYIWNKSSAKNNYLMHGKE